MTSQQFLVCDSSTLVNFKQWAKAISDFFVTAGWVQAADTGQVNWTSIGSVPGSGAFVYEIWKPGDALTVFYVKIEYGNVSGTNCPSLRLTLSSGTNGAGTATGFIVGPHLTNPNSFTAPSTTTQYECNFSGSTSRISAMMWRNGTNNSQQLFAIERSVDSAGAYTGAHATLIVCGWSGGGSCTQTLQQSLLFGVGAASLSGATNRLLAASGGLIVRTSNTNANVTSAFNGTIPFDTTAPNIGYLDYALTVVGAAVGADIADGVTFTVTLYGATRTYVPGKTANFAYAGPGNSSALYAICMRYD